MFYKQYEIFNIYGTIRKIQQNETKFIRIQQTVELIFETNC